MAKNRHAVAIGRKGGTVKTWKQIQADPRVLSAFVDSDGAWIWLKPGWTADPFDAHDVHEYTKGAARDKFIRVQPCHCEMCVAQIGCHSVVNR